MGAELTEKERVLQEIVRKKVQYRTQYEICQHRNRCSPPCTVVNFNLHSTFCLR